MGHKVHPTGFRLGVIRDWQAKWYADKHYAEFLQEDLKLREAIQSRYAEAAVSLVEIERQSNQVSVNIHTARPGIVIGRGGQRVDETRQYLEQLIGKRVQLNIQEIQQPELDAHLVSKAIAEQIERRVAYRRAMKQVMLRTMQAGAKGMRVSCAGRLGGAEIARRLTMHEGQVPLHTLRADIDYGFVEARTVMGRIGVKVWIYKGQVLPEPKEEEVEEIPAELVAEVGTEEKPSEQLAEVSVEEKPSEQLAEVGAEEKPSEQLAEVSAEEKPSEQLAEVSAEEKPSEQLAEVSAEETPSEQLAEVSAEETPIVELKEKPAKPKARRRAKAAPSPDPEETPAETVAEVADEAELSIEQGENNAATQTG